MGRSNVYIWPELLSAPCLAPLARLLPGVEQACYLLAATGMGPIPLLRVSDRRDPSQKNNSDQLSESMHGLMREANFRESTE